MNKIENLQVLYKKKIIWENIWEVRKEIFTENVINSWII